MIKFDFHVSRAAREKYKIEQSLFSITGKVILADYQQARILSEKINSKRRDEGNADQFVTAGQINALGLLHEIFHLLIRRYEESDNPGVFGKAINHLMNEISESNLQKTLLAFVEEFPPLMVYNNELTPQEYLNSGQEGKSNKEIILEEIILLHMENSNPAASNLRELYADDNLSIKTNYKQLIEKTEIFFDNELPTQLGGLPLFKLLRKPISANPFDLEKQLEFIRTEFGAYLGDGILNRLLRGVDLIREDYKLFVPHGGGEKGTPPVPTYDEDLTRLRIIREKLAAEKKLSEDERRFYLEYEKFTEDMQWIPEVVMVAKNVYVWLHQLSEKYKREIKQLDQIPDEELDQLARWNFNSLWLIGIWERSSASQKIKHLTGNISAVSSAYSLYDYVIANELGGEPAFQNLKDRAWARGIRMASDMVPNHMGIYSKWVTEKPDYFLQRNEPPYPNYSFTGPNLSEDDRVEVRIEDQYYTRKDAAVVFQRKDRFTGSTKYIYHGNDGTNMPWNDTAQLNLLNPEVRESLIQTIMHVARKTPIIRFDAAMTLAKKHFQRLWFPNPGSGGAIPSRSDYSMTIEQFNQIMPNEFWREVVDRINSEMPNVLLLAEAFWLMEGYFVRTLGMHRVYNSAFMHMMMKEENDKYRQLVTNTLEFNPEILKRYVNFMSNPDEETAINQFGKGDKYFGVAVMMLTMPGLPMFGHGQIEGFSEKYGMEYKQAYYNETPDEHLVWRHNKELFPLMKLRYLFSQVENFEFYDFIDKNGDLNQNVYAFSNRAGNELALVLYNNSYYETEGSIAFSNPKMISGNGGMKRPHHITELLNIKPYREYYYIYTDHRTQLQYLISGKEIAENGFRIQLFGYQYRVCLHFREVYDREGKYEKLYYLLNGKGVSSVDEALKEMELLPLHSRYENFFSYDNIEKIRTYLIYKPDKKKKEAEISLPGKLDTELNLLTAELGNFLKEKKSGEKVEKKFHQQLSSSRDFYQLWMSLNSRKSVTKWMKSCDEILPVNSKVETNREYLTFINLILLKQLFSKKSDSEKIHIFFDELLLYKPITNIIQKQSNGSSIHQRIELIKTLLTAFLFEKKKSQAKTAGKKSGSISAKKQDETDILSSIKTLLAENNVYKFLRVNEFEGITYFNKERFEELSKWILLFHLTEIPSQIKDRTIEKSKLKKTDFEKEIVKISKENFEKFIELINKAESSGYDFTKFQKELSKENEIKAKTKPITKKRKKV
ncbi:MAG: alpha-amylase family glycosyl hydrolase [Ignavibacteriaceae bacterium]|nr:alpha-amylase family glycosyl hydrolase [Ignavibacteriaceae bacterium]